MAEGALHELGEICTERLKFIKTCIRKRKYYCNFGTQLNRVIIENARQQLGQGWGSAEHPNCVGITIDELQKLDFNEMDFSEIADKVIADTQKNLGSIDYKGQTQNMADKLKDFYKNTK